MENREGGSVIGDGIRVSYLWGWSGNPAVVATSNSSSMRKGSKFRSAKLPMLRRTSAPCPSACSRDRITCNPEKKKKSECFRHQEAKAEEVAPRSVNPDTCA